MRALSYFLEEAARSLWRRRGASLLAAGTSTVSLLVLGLFLLAGSNASRISSAGARRRSCRSISPTAATLKTADAIERALTTSGLVSAHELRHAGGSAAAIQRAVSGPGGLGPLAADESSARLIRRPHPTRAGARRAGRRACRTGGALRRCQATCVTTGAGWIAWSGSSPLPGTAGLVLAGPARRRLVHHRDERRAADAVRPAPGD